MPMQQYSTPAKREAVGLYESGLSCRAVAEQVKIAGLPSPHFVTVLRWAKDAGKGRKMHGRRSAVSSEIVRALYDKGMGVDVIARRFRVGTATIYKRLHEAGANIRPSPTRDVHVLTDARLLAPDPGKTTRAEDIAAKIAFNVG